MKDQHGETMKIVLLPAADAPYDYDGKNEEGDEPAQHRTMRTRCDPHQ